MAGNRENTILVVNDAPDQLAVMSALLRKTGYTVATANDGHEGLNAAQRLHPNLVISDVAMPGIDGIELCRRIRADRELHAIPILLISAHRKNTESAVEGLQAGADDYIEAPYEPMRLIAKVARLIERARSEEALRESEDRFHSTFDQAAVGIAHVGIAGEWLLVNQKVCDILGYTSDELLQMTFQDVTHSDDLEADLANVRTLLAGELSNYVMKKRYVRKDGALIWIQLTVSLTRDRLGFPKYFISVLEDISERQQAEEALRQSEQRYRLLFENNPHPMWVYDIESLRFLAVNNAAVHHYGFSHEEFIGMTIKDIRPKADVPVLPDEISMLVEGVNLSGVWKHRKKDGTLIDVQIVAHHLDFAGRRAALVLAHDITEQKAAEEALRRSEEKLQQSQKLEAVGRLAGGLAHDFNNILTAITGYSDLVLRRLTAADPMRQNVEEIRRAANRAASLTHQLLAFSRKQIMQVKVLDLNAIVLDMKAFLRRVIGEDIDFSTNLEPEVGMVKADPSQLEQVIMNLAVNARDAMPEGGKLTIETKNVFLEQRDVDDQLSVKPGKYTVLSVSDTGAGMESETQKRIFEPFFTTKEQGKGTGLGLSMVYGIVKQSGGSIRVYSEAGRGTTFKIYLPLVEESGRRDQPVASLPDVPRGTETVLVVEDEDIVRELVREVLEVEGYSVVSARRGKDALKLCVEHPEAISLLVTDVVMPEMSGRELAERLTEIRPEVRVLFISGYTDDSVIRHGVLEAGTAFLQKPFTPNELARKVRGVLDAEVAE
jgi:PAS domain S-box-containing protein